MTGPLSRRRGSASIEFALAFPVLAMLFGGIVEYGWYFSRESKLQDATRAAARAGSAAGPSEDPRALALKTLDLELWESGLVRKDSSWRPDAKAVLTYAAPDTVLSVTVTLPYDGVWRLSPRPRSLSARSAMRLEVQR
jgi:hypothetical protein